MAIINGTSGNDFIHREGDGQNPIRFPTTELTGVTTGDDTINCAGGKDDAFGDDGNDLLDGGDGADFCLVAGRRSHSWRQRW